MSLPGCEFVRRFLLHALPKGFVRIRRYGILANCQRGAAPWCDAEAAEAFIAGSEGDIAAPQPVSAMGTK
jgi:hypothetical protein